LNNAVVRLGDPKRPMLRNVTRTHTTGYLRRLLVAPYVLVVS
jgi:hypothetical protein